MQQVQSNSSQITVKAALIIDRFAETSDSPGHRADSKYADWIKSSNELHACFENPRVSYQAIYLSSDQAGFSILEVAHRIRNRFPLSPIYFLYEDEEPLGKTELTRLGLHGSVRRSEMKRAVREQSTRLQSLVTNLQAASEKRIQFLNHGPTQEDIVDGYTRIPLEEALNGDICFFDIYLILANQKKLKIFQAKDQLDTKRVINYLEQGVRWVYVKNDSLNRCLHYFEVLSNDLLKSKSASNELKLLHVVSKAEKLTKGNPDNFIDEANHVIENMHLLFFNTKTSVDNVLQSYFKHSSLFSHAVSASLLSFLFSIAMRIESIQVRGQIGFAALFHDIGLATLPDLLQAEVESKMTPDEIKIFQTHPQKSFETLERLGISDDVVLQAVVQHHERRDHSGFPARLGAGQIHIFSEILGISDELVRFLENKKNEDLKVELPKFRESIKNQFSFRTLEAFDLLFIGEER